MPKLDQKGTPGFSGFFGKVFQQFAENEFTPALPDRLDETGEFDRDIHRKMSGAGFMGVKIPVKYGGQGGDTLAHVLLVEEFARISPVLSIYANTSNSLGSGPLPASAGEEQLMTYLPPVARGEKILAFCLTEPDAGSDAGGVAAGAVPMDDGWVLNGRKRFVSGAPMADCALVFARTDPNARGNRGISLFIVDMKLPGVSCGSHEDKMGIRGYPTGDIILEDVHVKKDALLGRLHYGFATAMKTLDGGRLGMAAQALGIAQGCLDEAVAYAKTRKQFGRAISNFQGVSFMIADMATELEAARELVYNTAVMKDAGAKDAGMRCSMSKYYAAEAYTAAVCQVVEKGMPDTLLVSATTIGRDLAPRCAARLQTGLNADCTLLHVGRQEYLDYLARESSQDLSEIEGKVTDNQLKMTMPAFGGHLMATITCPNYRPQMATVRPGVMKAGEYSEAAAARCVVERPKIAITGRDRLTEVLETVKEVKNTVDLTGAKVIVAVGMGIKKDPQKGIELAEQLAGAFDGVVGATRDVVTAGWIGEGRMIGQTGKIVRPKLYIGLGISGAIQHQGGMKDSEFIVSVNTDKRAPLFEIADCGLVGDLFDVVPAMLKAAKEA